MGNRQSCLAQAEGCDVMGYEGPWQSDRVPPSRSETLRAHPIYAPVAWAVCLIAGAAFWAAVYKVVY